MPRRRRPGLGARELEQVWAQIASGQRTRLDEIAGRKYHYLNPRNARFPFRSKLFDRYAESAAIEPLGSRPWEMRLTLPEAFSFIDDPDAAMAFLEAFVRVCRAGTRLVSIDQRACGSLDLCAGSVLNLLALEASRRLRTSFRGTYPTGAEPLEIVVATGLPKALKVPLPSLPTFHVFDLQTGGRMAERVRVSSEKELAAQRFIDYVTGCFERHGYTFARVGKARLGSLLGEVLANAEDHGDGRWWAAGYLRQPAGQPFGDCHLALFNFGPTLAETLQMLPPGELRSDIEAAVAIHRRRGLFGYGKWTEEGLWTLYALQEGVTRHFADPSQRRGVGTAEMIEAFQDLGRTADGGGEPRMCLVSGHTHILFDGRYRMAPTMTGGGPPRRVIAFNAANDLQERPAAGTVRHLDHFFPGTLLSLRFFVDRRYLEQPTSDQAPVSSALGEIAILETRKPERTP